MGSGTRRIPHVAAPLGGRRGSITVSAMLAVGTVSLLLLLVTPPSTTPAGPTAPTPALPIQTAAQFPLTPGSDYPTYLGTIGRTSSASGEQLIGPSSATSLHQIWSYDAFQPVQSQPVEANGSVYFGGKNGYEYALYASNGTLEWKTFLGQSKNDTGCGNVLGVTSTATISGPTLYVDGGYPYFDALNLSTGAIEWQAPIGFGGSAQGFYQWSSPLIYAGHAYVGIASDCDQPLVQAGLEMYSLANHSLVNYFDTSVPKQNGSSIWGSPAIDPATNTIFVATGNQYRLAETDYSDSILAFNASTLALVAHWQIPVSEQRGDGDFGVTTTVFTPPSGSPMVVAANKNGVLYGLYQSNLSIAWEQPICCESGGQDEHISAAYGDGYVYAVSARTTVDGVLYNSSVVEVNPLTGAIEWQVGFPGMAYYGYAAPLYVNHLLVVADGRSLMVLNASTGSLVWETNVSGVVQAAPSIARGEVFASTSSGSVYAFDTQLNATDIDFSSVVNSPLSASFNVTPNLGLPPYSFLWNFGDGGSSTVAAPVHAFAVAGEYNVSVTVSDLAGTAVTTTSTVAIGPGSNVTFIQTGLPAGTPWTVDFDRHSQTSNSTSIGFSGANGTHSYRVVSPTGFTAVVPSGSVVVSGTGQFVNVTFSPAIPVTFSSAGLPIGTEWSFRVAGLHIAVNASSVEVFLPAGNYSYSIDAVSGFACSTPAGTVYANGPNASVPLTFSPADYSVDFTEVGLAPGATWSVSLNGSVHTSNASLIRFDVTNGLYAFTVTPVGGFTAEPMKGRVHVHGSGTSEAVGFTPVYSVQFTETGLPAGTQWNVTLDTTVQSSTGSTILFYEPNGTYNFQLGVISGWQTADTGSVRVAGAARVVPHTFTRDGYLVTFEETGLASGTNWSLNVAAQTLWSTTNQIRSPIVNGTYTYSVANVPGYTNTPNGSITVQGMGFSVTVPFTPVRYALTFKETGLPTVKNWSITIGSRTVYSKTNTIVFHLTNGTYSYGVGAPPGYTTPLSGSATVAGAPQAVDLKFTVIRYQVTFTEEGLSLPRSWNVTIGSTTHSSTGSRLTFLLPDGTYFFSPTTSAANVTAASGNFTISGHNITISVEFEREGSIMRGPTPVGSVVVWVRPTDV